MKIEVKKIKHSPSLSEETNAFVADLYIDDEKVGTCKNSGQGGSTDIYPEYSTNEDRTKYFRKKIKQAEAFCKTLPGIKSSFGDKDLEMDLEFFVDLEVEKELRKKDAQKILKRIDKDCLKHIVIMSKKVHDNFIAGKSSEIPYKLFGWKRLIADVPTEVIIKQLPNIKAQLIGDEFIYNKNLPK